MPATYEEMLAFIQAQLPSPLEERAGSDGTLSFTAGEPAEVVVRLTQSEVHVLEFAVTWQEFTPVVEPIPIGSIRWSAMSPDAAIRTLRALLSAARESRLSKFVVCRICERPSPPEATDEDDVCDRCGPQETVH